MPKAERQPSVQIETRVHAKVLTPEQIDSYHENGFVVLKGAIPRDEARELGIEIDDAIKNVRKGQNIQWEGTFIDNNERTMQVVNDLHDGQKYSPRIARYLTDPRLVIPAAQLIGPELALHHIKAISKPGEKDGKRGGLFPMHQDYPFFRLGDRRALAALLACTEGNEENGGLIGYPGSHKDGPLTQDQESRSEDPNQKQSHLRKDKWPPEEATFIPTEPGDIVLFSDCFVHGSGINKTDKSRINLITQLKNRQTGYIDNVNPHPSHAQEMVLCDAKDLKKWGVTNFPSS